MLLRIHQRNLCCREEGEEGEEGEEEGEEEELLHREAKIC
jgi:hypothetical protein